MSITLIDEDRYAEEMERTVMPALAACRDEGWMKPAQGGRLHPLAHPGRIHYVTYDSARFVAYRGAHAGAAVPQGTSDGHALAAADQGDAEFKGAVVIHHGFTESAVKYCEMAWYLLLSGYSVAIIEARGHGESTHDVADESLVWIDDWRRYVADLSRFARTIGRDMAGDQPLFLYAHSMGGGIGAATLEACPDLFDRAVLTSPMIEARTGMPLWLGRAVAGIGDLAGLGRRIVPTHRRFDPVAGADDYDGASKARVAWYHRRRMESVGRHTNAATFGWLREALRMSRAVLDPRAVARVETPVLVFQAADDVFVMPAAQRRWVEAVRAAGGDARLVRMPGTRHEYFMEPNRILGPYLEQVIGFLDAGTSVNASSV